MWMFAIEDEAGGEEEEDENVDEERDSNGEELEDGARDCGGHNGQERSWCSSSTVCRVFLAIKMEKAKKRKFLLFHFKNRIKFN